MCLQVCTFKGLHVPWLSLQRVCLLSRRLSEACSGIHLALCCLKTMGLKISPTALALSRFLVQFWHTLEKCRIRQWMVSQYWGGRLGVLAMWRRSWAHSSGLTTSVNKGKKTKRMKGAALKRSPFEARHRTRAASSGDEQWKKCNVQLTLQNRTKSVVDNERKVHLQVIGCPKMLQINLHASFSSF